MKIKVKNATYRGIDFPDYNNYLLKEEANISNHFEDLPISISSKITVACTGSNGIFLFISTKSEDIEVITEDIIKAIGKYKLPRMGTYIFVRTENVDYFYSNDEFKKIEFVEDRFHALYDNTLRPQIDLNYIHFNSDYEMLFEPQIPKEYLDIEGKQLVINNTGDASFVKKSISERILYAINKEMAAYEGFDYDEETKYDRMGVKYRKYNTRTKLIGYSYKEDWYPVSTDDPNRFFILTVLMGWFGFHKYKTGEYWTAILYTLTCGGFGIFYLVDLFQMLLGTYSVIQTTYEEDESGNMRSYKSRIYLDKLTIGLKAYPAFFLAFVIAYLSTNYIFMPALNKSNAVFANTATSTIEKQIEEMN